MRKLASWIFAGTLALGAGSALAHEHGTKMSIDQLPAAARATFEQEAQGGKIEELRQESKHGKTCYSGEVVKNGQGIDLQVGEDGKVLKRSSPHNEATERGEHER